MTTVTENALAGVERPREEYRYEHFSLQLMLRDLGFSEAALKVGDAVPDVTVTDLNGSTVQFSDLVGERPLVLVTGSLSCPMTASSVPSLNRLHQDFGDRFDFVSLYVREAHPGELLPQPHSQAEKTENAVWFRQELGVRPRVIVDDVDGTLHRLLDKKPNAAFVFDATGHLVFRSLWASDEAGLRKALTSIRDALPMKSSQSTRMLMPMLKALGSISETMTRAGGRAHKDLLLAAPPMEVMGLVAGCLKPLPRALRGPALMAASLVATGTAALALLVAV